MVLFSKYSQLGDKWFQNCPLYTFSSEVWWIPIAPVDTPDSESRDRYLRSRIVLYTDGLYRQDCTGEGHEIVKAQPKWTEVSCLHSEPLHRDETREKKSDPETRKLVLFLYPDSLQQ